MLGVVADGDEHAVDGQRLALAALRIADDKGADFALAGVANLFHLGVPLEGDLRVGERLVLHDLRRPQRVAAMHHGHVRRELGQEDRLLHRRVAAADHRDWLAAEEEPVAGRAGGDAVTDQRPFRGKPEQPRRRTGGDDERMSAIFGVGQLDRERARAQVDCLDVALDDLRAEADRLRPHRRHQVRPHHAVLMPRPVLDHRRQHQLPAGLEPLDDERLEVGAGGIQRGGEAGRAGTDDDDAAIGHGDSE